MGFSFKSVLKAAGKTVSVPANIIGKGAKAIKKVPVVGAGLHSVYDTTVAGPFKVADAVVKGEKINKVAYNHFKDQVKNAQDIAPYAQTVVSVIPGVGPGVSGAIGVAAALSKGKPITDAVIEGARGALPGGPMAAAAFDVAVAAARGEPIDAIAINAIPGVSPDQKKLILAGLRTTKDVMNGKNPKDALLNNALDALPKEARAAAKAGMALAQGQALQKVMKDQAPFVMGKLIGEGGKIAAENPIFKAGIKAIPQTPEAIKGFKAGAGLMTKKLTPVALDAARKSLSAKEKAGFDVAIATAVGSSKGVLPADPKKAFGVAVTKGFTSDNRKAKGVKAKAKKKASDARTKRILKVVTKDPAVRKGAIIAAKQKAGLWGKIKDWLGID